MSDAQTDTIYQNVAMPTTEGNEPIQGRGDICTTPVPPANYPQPGPDAYPPAQYLQQPYPVEQTNPGLPQVYPTQDIQPAMPGYLAQPQPPAYDADKFAQPQAMPPVMQSVPMMQPMQPVPMMQPQPVIQPIVQSVSVVTQAAPVVVVQEQPRTIVVTNQAVIGRTYLRMSITCLGLSICFSWISLPFAIPALICSIMSSSSYNAGDVDSGIKQGRWALFFNIAAILTFIVFFIIVISSSAS
ncbi:uncharacterized protein [Dysidea avara]|uniref:uncharacterized protein n=1 Tax=Dysidea avara TaxID=196820 RepID=UPI00332904FF